MGTLGRHVLPAKVVGRSSAFFHSTGGVHVLHIFSSDAHIRRDHVLKGKRNVQQCMCPWRQHRTLVSALVIVPGHIAKRCDAVSTVSSHAKVASRYGSAFSPLHFSVMISHGRILDQAYNALLAFSYSSMEPV